MSVINNRLKLIRNVRFRFQVLVAPADSVQWVLGRSGGSVPEGAVRVGRNPGDGIPYYIGRSAFRSSLIPGKIYMSNFFAPSSGGM